ncbi:MAG: hypothetical protein QHH24_07535 [Candidatus Bathyarchaeota archaeon]|jgi:hypothetical protein|nr:hypothetical protein [Candidatus Bathyarchaeota archaeon]
MTDWVKKALTKTTRQKAVAEVTEPDIKLIYGVKLALALIFSLTALEAIHLLVLGRWNSEIFSAITALTGTVTGIFISQRA